VARGEAGPTSDVDVLVDFGPRCGLWEAIGLKHELEDLLGCPVDLVGRSGLSPYLRDRILNEAVPL
jgi:hypothetical protein